MPSLMCLICPILPEASVSVGGSCTTQNGPRNGSNQCDIELAIYLSQDLALMAGGGYGNVWMQGERRCCVLPCPSYHMPPQQVRYKSTPAQSTRDLGSVFSPLPNKDNLV